MTPVSSQPPVCTDVTCRRKGKPLPEVGFAKNEKGRLFVLYRCPRCGQRKTRLAA
jgi:hypothetical protein